MIWRNRDSWATVGPQSVKVHRPPPIRRTQKVCFMISWFDKPFPVARGVYFALSSLGALLRSGSRVCPRSRFEAFGWTLKLKNHVSYLIWCTGTNSSLGHHASLKHMSAKLREREMALTRAIPVFAWMSQICCDHFEARFLCTVVHRCPNCKPARPLVRWAILLMRVLRGICCSCRWVLIQLRGRAS